MASAQTAAPAPPVTGPDASIVIPVFMNESSIEELLDHLGELDRRLAGTLEVVFVVDGSPDRSFELLAAALPEASFRSQLIAHSRNFGSFAAIRTGLARARGPRIGVMAADLQEPPELMVGFLEALEGGADLAIGRRLGRDDPRLSALFSRVFWALYRRLVWSDVPPGGVDVFACTAEFAAHLVEFKEANSSLVTLALWMGYERVEVPYERLSRRHGQTSWSLRRRMRYLSDSVYSFTDLPIRLLLGVGTLGVIASIIVAVSVGIARLAGDIDVPGYAATAFFISFFAALNLVGLGILGAYVWRTFENTKERPAAIVMSERDFVPGGTAE